ncbi:MAG: Xaa-Pro peptidase family protein [bacterium]|nr:Xaa-Pro peptidase family protein [bacterium]
MLLNKERAHELMTQHNLVAMIGTTLENVTYLTGHVGWAQRVYRSLQSYALLVNDPQAGSDLIMTRSDNSYYAAYGGYADNVYSYGGQSALIIPEGYTPPDDEMRMYLHLHESGGKYPTIVDALVTALKNRGITKGRIALDQEGCPPALFERLKDKLPDCEFLPGTNLFLMIRLVKTPEEIERLRAAAEVNENAIAKFFGFIKEGVSENDVAEVWRQEVARPGGMWHWFHFNSGPRSCFIFPPTNRKLKRGEHFMFDAGLFFRNYNADTGSCGSIGEPSAQSKREWKAVETGFHEGVNIVKEGVTGGQIYNALKKGIHKAGLPGFNSPFAGHTVGLEAREFPFILADEVKYDQPFLPKTSEIPLPENAVINIEAPIGTMGYGGYQIEYSVIVKKDGWEPLLKQERHFRILGA